METLAFAYGCGPRLHQKRPRCSAALWAASSESSPAFDAAKVNVDDVLSQISFDKSGLVPAIAQQYDTGEVLMMAYMNADSIRETLRNNRAVYYSRSRKQLWRKGDTSGQTQELKDFKVDCDGDTILVSVDQLGVACHTGRRSCFYRAIRGDGLESVQNVLIDPNDLYGDK
mmetsp:Transcript_12597/g.38542  ORF Transcript_12597/g.38542 Transcript_12597/m.38542 type:complete len:171 (-) Transcript_12597:240-752(-)